MGAIPHHVYGGRDLFCRRLNVTFKIFKDVVINGRIGDMGEVTLTFVEETKGRKEMREG